MRMRDAVNDPGKGQGTGDDRYGFDEGAGTAWVVDGATDVGSVRLFPDWESDAAWFAEALSTRFITPPAADEAAEDYLRAAITDVAARTAGEARFDLANAPRDSWPVAALIWIRVQADAVEIARFFDCVALVQDGAGGVQVFSEALRPDEEEKDAGRFDGLSWEAKLPHLRASRAAVNTPGRFLDPTGAQTSFARDLVVDRIPRPAGGRILLMSDGLYRLVAPFSAMTDRELLDTAADQGLGAVVTKLRGLERAPGGPSRWKQSDDAAGVLLDLDAI